MVQQKDCQIISQRRTHLLEAARTTTNLRRQGISLSGHSNWPHAGEIIGHGLSNFHSSGASPVFPDRPAVLSGISVLRIIFLQRIHTMYVLTVRIRRSLTSARGETK
jgi:hypothetical protein